MEEAGMNREAALLCGYRDVADDRDREEYGQDHQFWESRTGEAIGNAESLPNFCQNRNALPELLAAVKVMHKHWEYVKALAVIVDADTDSLMHNIDWVGVFRMEQAEPKSKVEAALRACNRWKD